MANKLKFILDVGPADWSALPRTFSEGDVVVRFSGHTYGLDREDAIYGKRDTIPCVIPGKEDEGFFTVPAEYLEDENGDRPSGSYFVPTIH